MKSKRREEGEGCPHYNLHKTVKDNKLVQCTTLALPH